MREKQWEGETDRKSKNAVEITRKGNNIIRIQGESVAGEDEAGAR